MQTLQAGKADQGRPLLEFLASELAVSRRKAKGLLDRRVVFVNRRRIWMARHPLRPGDRIEIIEDQPPATQPCPVLWRDGQLIAVNKPAGVEVTGKDALEGRLRDELSCPSLAAIHRLDKNTTGCLLFAVEPEIKSRMIDLFRENAIQKSYRALAAGRMKSPTRTIRVPIDGKSAITHLKVVKSTDIASHLSVRIETGRTHQIRKHLAGIGHPILGDPQYGGGKITVDEHRTLPRPMLHAEELRFPHPDTGAEIHVQAPLPEDFRQALRTLKLN